MVYRLEGGHSARTGLAGNDIVVLLVYNLGNGSHSPRSVFVALPRVFVTRRIPEAGLALLTGRCEVDLWPEALPPPYETLLAHSKECEGVLSLLTDKIDANFLTNCPKLK